MALTESKMLPLQTQAPNFRLKDTEGKIIDFNDFKKNPAYLVMFICNHCPYVQHLRRELSAMTSEYIKKGVAIFGINSNDAKNYPEDSPQNMAIEKKEQGYKFPYLFDENQEVARAYDAACTPDFYLFDSAKKLVYRGQFDDSRPGNNKPVTGHVLRGAMDAVLNNQKIPELQQPSIGCNIKWVR